MSRKAKLLEKLRRSPNAVRFEEVRTLLEWYGLTLESARGSHYTYLPQGSLPLVVIRHTPHVKAYIVKRVIEFIDSECTSD